METIRYGLLGLLERGEAHGYRLQRLFEESTGAVWQLNPGQVYQALHSLERLGLVAGYGDFSGRGPARRVFRLTPKGRATLERWQARRPSWPQPFRDELLIRLLLTGSHDWRSSLQHIEKQEAVYRTYVTRLIARKRSLRERPPGESRLLAELAIEAAFLRADAHLKWLAHCRETIAAEASAPAPDLGRSAGRPAPQEDAAAGSHEGRTPTGDPLTPRSSTAVRG